MILDRDNRHRGLPGLWRAAGEIRGRAFDMAVLLQNAVQAALLTRTAGIPIRLGYNTDGRGWLLHPSIPLQPGDRMVHETEYYLRMLERAGLKALGSRPRFHLDSDARHRAERLLTETGLIHRLWIGLGPGAAYGPAKQWPAAGFAAAAAMIAGETGGSVVILGGRGESDTAAETERRLKEEHGVSRVINLAGQTDLSLAAALLERCDLFISNDSGLMHVAAAVGAPVTAIFGSTNPRTTGPVGARIRLVHHPVECAPCLKPRCGQPVHWCMEGIRPEEVATAGLELLKSEPVETAGPSPPGIRNGESVERN